MKRTISAALAAVLALTLAGCNAATDSGEAPAGETEAAVTTSSTPPETTLAEEKAPTVEAAVIPTEQAAPTAEAAETEETDPTDYIALIQQYDNAWLGLPSASKVYIFSDKGEYAEIDGVKCRGLSCYDEHEGVLYYMCDYYISADGALVYRDETSKNNAEGEPPVFVLMPEEKGFAPLDPTKQTADEIFAQANEVSALFTPVGSNMIECSNAEDAEDFIELDGQRFDRVTDERFATKEQFFASLDTCFDFSLVSAWMEQGSVIEQDGNIYVRHNGGVGGNPYFDHREYELTFLSEEEAVFTEYRYYIYEGNEEEVTERTYRMAQQNGIWRFTEFALEQGD